MSLRLWICSVLLSLLAFGAVESAGTTLLYVGPGNFSSIVGSPAYDIVLLDYFAPWCGHCKRLEPELIEAYDRLLTLKLRVLIAKVDAEANYGLKNKEGVGGFPTLKVYKHGKYVEDYKGPRFADQIANYLKKSLHGPQVTNIKEGGVRAFLDDSSMDVVSCVFVLYSVAGPSDEAAYSVVAAKHAAQLWFGQTQEAYKGDDSEASVKSVVVAYDRNATPGKEVVGQLTAPFTEEALEDFVAKNMWITILPISQAIFPQAVGSPRPVVMFLIEESRKAMKEMKMFMSHATRVARQRRDEYLFASVDVDLLGKWVDAEFGLAHYFPTVLIYQNNRTLFFHSYDWMKMDTTVAKSLQALILAYEEGRISPQVLGTAGYWNRTLAYALLYPSLAVVTVLALLCVLCALYFVLFSDMTPIDEPSPKKTK